MIKLKSYCLLYFSAVSQSSSPDITSDSSAVQQSKVYYVTVLFLVFFYPENESKYSAQKFRTLDYYYFHEYSSLVSIAT